MLAQTVGVGIALAIHRRQKPLRLTFNVAQRACTTLLAVVFFAVCRSALPAGWPSLWVSFFGATPRRPRGRDADQPRDRTVGRQDQAPRPGDRSGHLAHGREHGTRDRRRDGLPPAASRGPPRRSTGCDDLPRGQGVHRSPEEARRSPAAPARNGLAQRSLEREDMVPVLLHHMREMFNADIAEFLLWPEGRDRTPCAARSGRATKRSHSNPFPWIPHRASGLAWHPSVNRCFSRGRSATRRSGASSETGGSGTRSSRPCRRTISSSAS